MDKRQEKIFHKRRQMCQMSTGKRRLTLLALRKRELKPQDTTT